MLADDSSSTRKYNEITGLQLFAMTTSMVMTVYGFAPFAQQGPTAIFFLFLAGILWFIPVTQASGEMASIEGWEKGGIFTWTKNMLGERTGWAAMFYQWVHITVGLDSMMYFIIGCVSMMFKAPYLNTNMLVRFGLMMVIIWGIILLQRHGAKVSGTISQWCFMLGIVLPVALLLVLFVTYLAQGNPTYIHLSWHTIIPHSFGGSVWVGFVPFILAFCGAEGSAPHVKDLKNPGVYPKVMFALALSAILSDVIGSMSIAMTIPRAKIQTSTGIVYTYGHLIHALGVNGTVVGLFEWLIALLLAVGVIGEISSWVIGPNDAMFEAAKAGFLPARYAKPNKYGVPTKIMYLQGAIVTLTAVLMTFLGGGSADMAFDMAMASTVAQYTLMYMIMFVAYMVLLLKHKDLKREYTVSKSTTLKMIMAILGFALSALGFVVTFIPTTGLSHSARVTYFMLLLITSLIVFVLPFILYRHHAKWKKDVDALNLED
ncbi:amino acid permease [Lactobacillus buchneri]|nr:amino acid permease [Lentilactobacillus buchneri]